MDVRAVDAIGAVDAPCDLVHLLEQRQLVWIEMGELRASVVGQVHNVAGELLRSGRTLLPVSAQYRLRALGLGIGLNGSNLHAGIGGEMVDRDHGRDPELANDLDVATKIRASFLHRFDVRGGQFALLGAAVHFQRADRRYDHGSVGLQGALTAFDIEELLGT